MTRPAFSLGIEEEYLIVDRESLDLVRTPDPRFMKSCQAIVGKRVTNEYLQCQIEVGTSPCATIRECGLELAELRAGIAEAAEEFNYAPIAASTHPFAKWRDQTHTRKERYDALRDDLGQSARRLLICGMHVHIGIEEEDMRIDLMNQVIYFLPHLLALSCSSPFWEGEDTSLASYRLAVFDALPRTGIPDPLSSYGEYSRLVEMLVDAKCLEDATKIWWDIRPSAKFPTLEQRMTDVCSKLDEALAIAATFQSLLAYLFRLRTQNLRWRNYPATLISENRWRAQRNGTHGKLLDLGKGKLVDLADLVEELIEILEKDADGLECRTELLRIRDISRHGNSADRQRRVFQTAISNGASRQDALQAVVEQLVSEFVPVYFGDAESEGAS